ncbi:kinase-like protein [Cryphonectria parasitica EP155]|uniref:Kinase-like protein n=1 Tax=Cryphonectria parasitica (strain ATCC 38755 / EP155) TaxID=660469 RepID=A0A9P4Y2Z5_CRYP1|nr:kinase-like protein [Cryphonectria parasitica EP155]KAF3765539.1 kinase-like protein [Cryphonectria parasitica EP155]
MNLSKFLHDCDKQIASGWNFIMSQLPQRQPDHTPSEDQRSIPKIFVQAPSHERKEHVDQEPKNITTLIPKFTTLIPKYTKDIDQPLNQQLHQHKVKHAQEYIQPFWPTAIWKALLTQESIRDELLRSGVGKPVADNLSMQILLPGCKARVLIFTILVLLAKSASIEHVLVCKKGICDNQLPLVLKIHQGKSVLMREMEPITCCFENWDTYILEAFCDHYRRLTVPVFGLREGSNEINHQKFDPGVILPWCEVDENVTPVPAMSGGYGTVTKVRIHPLCHQFHDVLESINVAGGLFAVKKLKTRTKVDFEQEVNALKRFSGKTHRHLVTLLATFEQREQYHMIFPWADCDLDHYWSNVEPNPDWGDVDLIRWLSKQCLGIMEAVSIIHNPSHLQSDKRFGRHGDIKAENILWYGSGPRSSTRNNDRGILVISDLGLTAINSDKSKSMQPNTGLKTTPSYRPPECDIKGGTISRAFDIWTLGCLYLELLCWLLKGSQGKKKFDGERMTTFIFGTKTDIFFDIQRTVQYNKEAYVFTMKEAVTKKISDLHSDENCTLWMHDLLDLVEEGMLVVLSEDRKRKTSHSLLEILREMDQKCQFDEHYCLRKARYAKLRRAPAGTLAELNEEAKKMVNEMKPDLKEHKRDGRELHKSKNAGE